MSELTPQQEHYIIRGGTPIIGILIFPWKLMADPHGFIFLWLIGNSALLGSLAGVMICDYYLIRKSRLHLTDLFRLNGRYPKWNAAAWIALGLSLAPVLPGFLVQVGGLSSDSVAGFWQDLYSYAWF